MKNSTFGLIALATLSFTPISGFATQYTTPAQTFSAQGLHQEFEPSSPLASTRVATAKGQNPNLVAHQEGALIQVNSQKWIASNSHGTYKFQEVNLDERSVSLHAVDEPVSIQLEMWTKLSILILVMISFSLKFKVHDSSGLDGVTGEKQKRYSV